MILVRLILISIIIFLLVRSVSRIFSSVGGSRQVNDPVPENKEKKGKGVPKEVGEYVDYEEVK